MLRNLLNENVWIPSYQIQRWREAASVKQKLREIGSRDDVFDNIGGLALCKEALSEKGQDSMIIFQGRKALKEEGQRRVSESLLITIGNKVKKRWLWEPVVFVR